LFGLRPDSQQRSGSTQQILKNFRQPEKFPAAREQQQPKQLFGLVQQDRSRIFFYFTC